MTTTTTKQFQVGKTYATRSLCDYNCIFTFEVLARSKSFITLRAKGENTTYRVKIHFGSSDAKEWVYPLGKYSMAPTIDALDLVGSENV